MNWIKMSKLHCKNWKSKYWQSKSGKLFKIHKWKPDKIIFLWVIGLTNGNGNNHPSYLIRNILHFYPFLSTSIIQNNFDLIFKWSLLQILVISGINSKIRFLLTGTGISKSLFRFLLTGTGIFKCQSGFLSTRTGIPANIFW